MELEVVMQEGQVIAEDLMARLGVEGSDLVEARTWICWSHAESI
jgi:hypothetical protein